MKIREIAFKNINANKNTNFMSNMIIYRDVLSMGASRPWQDIIRQMTRGRTNRIDASAMLKYFEPLNVWLRRQNEMQPVIGWIINRDDRGWSKNNVDSRKTDIIL